MLFASTDIALNKANYVFLDKMPCDSQVFSRNSVFSQLNPDCKNPELLKDYTREGEPIGRLKVNAIENHDNTHEIAFKNYINWLVNKQLQEKNDHQGNIEPDISVLKPDFTDVNILEEVTMKGELVLCLDAHDVESYDGDTDTEKLTFNDDTCLMADKQLKKEKLYGRINELHIPYTSLLQKNKIMLFTKTKHCKKCFNSKIIRDCSLGAIQLLLHSAVDVAIAWVVSAASVDLLRSSAARREGRAGRSHAGIGKREAGKGRVRRKTRVLEERNDSHRGAAVPEETEDQGKEEASEGRCRGQ
ncbi:hypothetical protein NDU88_007385 [Pleurodeles waltl]|uniref:Uncharacterized protein n=1 Tax=Pleurodeles waltl TaxID=8319 RepID=A0AAV7VS09_PLEWA|nr:hypothetical protein NDU88_007385 [Pleurodeles waltl]